MGAVPIKGGGKRALGLLLIASLLILPGCWDRKELNEIALIRAIGIDRAEDGQIEVSLLQAIPQRAEDAGGGEKTGGTQRVLTARSINIPEAKEKLQQMLGREIFTGHQEVVVFGERFARAGIGEALDYMARQPQVRLDAVVFVCDGSPKEIFTTIPLAEITASESLYKLARVEGYTEISVMRVLREVTGDGKSTVIPVVKKTGQKSLSLDGLALFRGERMVDHLDRKSKEALMWIRNEYTTGTVNARIRGEKGYVAMKVNRTKTELIPKLKGKKPRMIIRMTSENVLSYNGTGMNLYYPSNMDRIARAMESELQKRLRNTVERVRRDRADAFGFAELFHREYPEKWARMKKDWNERLFPQMDVDIEVRVKLRWPGMTDK
ncbi:Ger(x)C family spore germination protein [Planifilum fimeticola]